MAIYCRPATGCTGNATLTLAAGGHGARRSRVSTVGRSGFSLPGGRTSHLAIRVSASVMRLIRAHHGVSVTLTAEGLGTTVSAPIGVKIF